MVCQPGCAHCGYSYVHVADSSDQCRHDLTKALQSATLYNETVGRAAHVVDEATRTSGSTLRAAVPL